MTNHPSPTDKKIEEPINIEQALQQTLGFGVKEFIEKAIEGNWKPQRWDKNLYNIPLTPSNVAQLYGYSFGDILLDPRAWIAVGKTEGWTIENENCTQLHTDAYVCKMHDFIDALAEQAV